MRASRRLAALLIPLVLSAAPPAVAQAPENDPFGVRLEAVGEGIWAARRPRPERQPVMGNGVFIINDDHVVVVDGAGSPLFADRAIRALRSVTDLPARTLVITSWHGDQHLGAWRWAEAFPGLEIVAHRFTREAMAGAPMDYVQALRASLPGQLEDLRAIARDGHLPDGSPIPAYQREDFADLLAYGDLVLSELDAARVTPPTRVFEDTLFLSGERRVEVRHLGRGNTAGDAVVWLPDDGVLVAGDTVVAPTPFGSGSYPRSWSRVLREIRDLAPRVIVPGHGPVLTDTRYLDLLIETLDTVAAEAERFVEAELGPGTFRAHFEWGGLPLRFHGNDPRLRVRFEQWFATPVLNAAHNEASGKPNEPLVRSGDED